MMEDNQRLAQQINGAVRSAGLPPESSSPHRPPETRAYNPPGLENNQQNHHRLHLNNGKVHRRQKSDLNFQSDVSHLMNFGTPDSSLDRVLLREEVSQLQEEVFMLRQMKKMLSKDLEESHGCSTDSLSSAELRVQLAEKEQELKHAMEVLQVMKGDRRRMKVERADLLQQMQQLYSTLESREEQLRDFMRNYHQHSKECESAVTALAKEKHTLEREKQDLRRQTQHATEEASSLYCQIDMKQNRIKELEAELTMAKQSLASLTKDRPRHQSELLPAEAATNGCHGWAMMQADLPLTAAIRQSHQALYHSHPASTQLRTSPCHPHQPPVISDAWLADSDRSSTPSDINSPAHRNRSLCNSMEDLEEQKRKKKKEKKSLGSLSRVFVRGKSQHKSLDAALCDGTSTPELYIHHDSDW